MSKQKAPDHSGRDLNATEEDPLLEISGLKKHFRNDEGFLDRMLGDVGNVRAVDGVELTVHSGETLGIVGESGCGKSTLCRTILNLENATEGSVKFDGEELTGFSGKEMRPYRRRMQMIFQNPLGSLNPRKTIGEILTAPMEVHDIGNSDSDRMERAEDLLERVGMKPRHVDRYPRQFSGGQQQRVGIARALAVDPDLLIADEPVSALDVSVQAQILNLLEDLQDEFDLAIVFVAHDLSVIYTIADRVAVMYLGEVVETAPVDVLFENPEHPYTRSLLSAVPRTSPEDREERIVLEGTVPSPLEPPSGCRFHTRCPSVIPPAEWSGSQSAFRAAFTFRNRLEAGEIDPDAVRTQLEAEGDLADDESVAGRITERALPGELEDQANEIEDVIDRAALALARGDDQRAIEVVSEVLHSPCQEQAPRRSTTEERHMVSCHRLDDEHPSEVIWPT